MSGSGPREDGCTCGEIVTEHLPRCPVVPLTHPLSDTIPGPFPLRASAGRSYPEAVLPAAADVERPAEPPRGSSGAGHPPG